MVARQLSKRERIVLSKLIQGRSRYSIARETGYAYSSVNDIVSRLIFYNEIRAVPGTNNPVLYDYVRNVTDSVSPSPKGDVSEKAYESISYAKKSHIPTPDELTKKWRVHLKGYIKMKVVTEGRMETIHDGRNIAVAKWVGQGNPNGRKEYEAIFYAYGRELKFNYRRGNKGTKTIAFWPQDVFLENEEKEQGPEKLIDRAKYIRIFLQKYGWVLEPPEVKGKWHFAINEPKLAEQYKDVAYDDNAESWVDTSGGSLEVETSTSENAEILNNLPSKVKGIYAKLSEVDDEETKLRKENKRLRIEVLESENFLLERQSTAYEIMRRQVESEDTLRPARRKTETEAMYG